MTVRKSVEDTFVVAGTREEWLPRCQRVLEAQGFTKVEASSARSQLTANYKKATIWGSLEVSLLPEGPESTRVAARATANVDNVFALFGSPGRKIIDRFKQGIG